MPLFLEFGPFLYFCGALCLLLCWWRLYIGPGLFSLLASVIESLKASIAGEVCSVTSLMYWFTASDFHSPCLLIACSGVPCLCKWEAPPLLNECEAYTDGSMSQAMNACLSSSSLIQDVIASCK